MTFGFIQPHGGYQDLLSYRKSLIGYDATVHFCKWFLDKRDRTVDQMVQAARSGKQNIIEGSMASGTSKEMEIKLMNVARASLEELLEDYRDFLRTNDGLLWDKNSEQALFVRKLGRKDDESYTTYRTYCSFEAFFMPQFTFLQPEFPIIFESATKAESLAAAVMRSLETKVSFAVCWRIFCAAKSRR